MYKFLFLSRRRWRSSLSELCICYLQAFTSVSVATPLALLTKASKSARMRSGLKGFCRDAAGAPH